MHVLITRPKTDAQNLKQRIEALGCAVSIAPLIEIELLPISDDTFDAAVGIIATSRNALAALENTKAIIRAQKLPLYAVGHATAQYALRLGFQNVITGSGTAADLVPHIVDSDLTTNGPIIHLAGDHLAFDLKSALIEENIPVQQITVYRSIAAQSLPQTVVDDISSGSIDAVILMSPRTAQTWCELMGKMISPLNKASVTHICLSEAVANALSNLSVESIVGANHNDPMWRPKVTIAQHPTLNSLLAIVQSLANGDKTG